MENNNYYRVATKLDFPEITEKLKALGLYFYEDQGPYNMFYTTVSMEDAKEKAESVRNIFIEKEKGNELLEYDVRILEFIDGKFTKIIEV